MVFLDIALGLSLRWSLRAFRYSIEDENQCIRGRQDEDGLYALAEEVSEVALVPGHQHIDPRSGGRLQESARPYAWLPLSRKSRQVWRSSEPWRSDIIGLGVRLIRK